MMQQIKHLLTKLFRGRSSYASEPEAVLFKKLRLHLTFWYSIVLGGALLLFCVVIYFSVRYMLLASVRDELAGQAHGMSNVWMHNPNGFCRSLEPDSHALPPPLKNRPVPPRFMSACYDSSGHLLLATTRIAQSPSGRSSEPTPKAFLDASLVRSVLRHGSQTDVVDGGDAYGLIYRYALVVSDPQAGGIQGVILIGESIAPQEAALNILLIVLVCTGGLVLAGAVVGGLFLSHRAMLPARVAFARQQNFIANASHELRTPLTFLCANTEILLEDGRNYFPPEDVALLEDIQTEAAHMAALANSMLTLARLDAGDIMLHREHDVLDLTELAESMVHQGRALANQRNIHLEAVEGPKPLFVVGDPLLLEQTVLVLLENAIKYNRPDGQVIVRTSLHDNQARLEVQDTGVGIAPEHLSHLGERFYRVDKARSRAAGGTGLGLSIARGIVRAHGGFLQFTSQPGQGTTVVMTLPATNIHALSKKDTSQALV